MEKREPLNIKKLIIIYNIIQVVLNIIVSYEVSKITKEM